MGIITDILKEIPLSAVLKERLTEAEAKFSVLTAKLTDAEVRIQELESDNQNLKMLLEQKDEEIAALKETIETLKHDLEQSKLSHFTPHKGTPSAMCS